MEKQIILEINRLNELMNLPLIMESPGDWITTLKKVVKGIVGIAESDKALLKTFIEGGSIIGTSKEELITILRRKDVGDDIITALEKEAGKITNATEKSAALSKVNELKALRNDVSISDDLLKIKQWRDLDHDAQLIYGEFTPYITPKVLGRLNLYKNELKNMTLTADEQKIIGKDLEACGLRLQKYINEHKDISAAEKEKAEKAANYFIKAGRWYMTKPIKNTGKILSAMVGIASLIYGVGAMIGGYQWICRGDIVSIPFKKLGLCDSSGGGNSDNGTSGIVPDSDYYRNKR
jgi:hypothetical protein